MSSLIVKTQEERDRDHEAEHAHGAEDDHKGKCGCKEN